MTDYTPSDAFVAHAYAYGMNLGSVPPMPDSIYTKYREEFYRWLEQHDMEIREETRQEAYIVGYDEGYQAGQENLWQRVEEEYL